MDTLREALEDAAQNNHQRQHDDSEQWRFHKTANWRDCPDHECKRYREALAARSSAPTELEAAFKAGYHAHWTGGRYVFDPALSPGDPDGAFKAWQALSMPSHACDCITSGNTLKPKQHGADLHAKNCAIYGQKWP